MNDLSIHIVQTHGDRRVEQKIELKSLLAAAAAPQAEPSQQALLLPQQRFTKLSADGVTLRDDTDDFAAVQDHHHGLMWSAATLPEAMNWKAAQQACAELRLLGHSDWRLPTIRELLTLVDYERYNPAIDVRYFPNTKASGYWTSSPDASDPSDCAWIVHFGGGDAGIRYQPNAAFVRAVRSVSAPSGQ